MKKIALLYNDWDVNEYRRKNKLYGGIGYYRTIKPAQLLSKYFQVEVLGAQFEYKMTDEKYERLAENDLIIFKPLRYGKDNSNILATAKYFKKKAIIDVDDNYFAIRPDNPAFTNYEKGNGAREFLATSMELANGIIVSTNPLRKLYKKLNKNIDVLPNCNDINDWPKEVKKWGDEKIRIGFAGGRGHLADLNMILEPLSYIMVKYPNTILEICGALLPQEIMAMTVKMNELCKKNLADRIRFGGGTLAFEGYPEMLAGFGWDIVLAPLIPDSFNECKSHIRWMESAMVKCPVVASPVYPYAQKIDGVHTIQDGKTGFLAYDSGEWYAKLEALILNAELRKEIAENTYTYIKDNWQYEHWEDKWLKVISKYL